MQIPLWHVLLYFVQYPDLKIFQYENLYLIFLQLIVYNMLHMNKQTSCFLYIIPYNMKVEYVFVLR